MAQAKKTTKPTAAKDADTKEAKDAAAEAAKVEQAPAPTNDESKTATAPQAPVAAADQSKDEKPAEKETVKAVEIRTAARKGTFRRCGHSFSAEASYFALDYFDEDQAKTIDGEPRLIASVVEVDPDEVTVLAKPKDDDKE